MHRLLPGPESEQKASQALISPPIAVILSLISQREIAGSAYNAT
jgi:hypothetical protein